MHTRAVGISTIIALALVAACGEQVPTPPFLGQLTVSDMAGDWNVAFRLDSVRDCSSGACRLVQAGPRPIIVGDLAIADRYDTLHTAYLTAQLQVDFQPALGRQVTCLVSPQSSLVRPGDSGIADFWFTPGSADCGLFASGQFDGREFRGTWGEPSFTGQPLSAGTFRMWRKG